MIARHALRCASLVAMLVLLGACGEAHVVRREPGSDMAQRGQPPPRRAGANEVEVVRGDTLYGIAFRNGMDFRDLAAINGIEPPYTIYVGQVIRLRERAHAALPVPPVAAPPRPAPVPPIRQPASSRPAVSGAPATTAVPPPSTGPRASVPTPFETVPSPPVPPAPHPAAPPAVVAAPPPPSPATTQPSAAAPAGTTLGTIPPPPRAPRPTTPEPAVEPLPHPAPVAIAPPPVAPVVERTPSAAVLPAVVAPVGGVGWRWPAKGPLLDRFAAGDATRQGIDIGGNAGDPVLAASEGVVVYSGSGLVGYGELIIIKHSDEWLSAYGHNRKRLVQEGQRVRAGQPIAEMGSTGAPRDELHFEIRRNGKPVDPQKFLPASR